MNVFNSFRLWQEPDPLDVDLRIYDWVLLVDIVEHLRYPERFLDQLRSAARSLGGRPRILVTTGNVELGS